MVKKAAEVTNYVEKRVGRGTKRRVRITKASQIRCNNMIAVVSQVGDLVAPSKLEFREAME